MKPHYINRIGGYIDPIVGYTDGPWPKPIREVTLSETTPLTYVDCDGWAWQPDRHFTTDWGSIPRGVQLLPGYDRERFVAFLLHDSAYQDHGLWRGVYQMRCEVMGPLTQMTLRDRSFFRFVPMTRRQADDMLRDGIVADGGRPTLARTVWLAVRVFGPKW